MGCHFFLPKAIWCGQKIKKNKKKIRPRKVEWLFQSPTAYWGLKTVFQCQVQGILNHHITDLWHKDIRPTLDSSSLVFSAWACFKSLSISSIRAIFEVLALKKTQKPFKNTASYWCLIRYTHTHTQDPIWNYIAYKNYRSDEARQFNSDNSRWKLLQFRRASTGKGNNTWRALLIYKAKPNYTKCVLNMFPPKVRNSGL